MNHLDSIKAIAVKRWGDRWLKRLTEEVCSVEPSKNYHTTHAHLSRLFSKAKNCKLDLFVALVAAVGYQIDLVPYSLQNPKKKSDEVLQERRSATINLNP